MLLHYLSFGSSLVAFLISYWPHWFIWGPLSSPSWPMTYQQPFSYISCPSSNFYHLYLKDEQIFSFEILVTSYKKWSIKNYNTRRADLESRYSCELYKNLQCQKFSAMRLWSSSLKKHAFLLRIFRYSLLSRRKLKFNIL